MNTTCGVQEIFHLVSETLLGSCVTCEMWRHRREAVVSQGKGKGIEFQLREKALEIIVLIADWQSNEQGLLGGSVC